MRCGGGQALLCTYVRLCLPIFRVTPPKAAMPMKSRSAGNINLDDCVVSEKEDSETDFCIFPEGVSVAFEFAGALALVVCLASVAAFGTLCFFFVVWLLFADTFCVSFFIKLAAGVLSVGVSVCPVVGDWTKVGDGTYCKGVFVSSCLFCVLF